MEINLNGLLLFEGFGDDGLLLFEEFGDEELFLMILSFDLD